MEKNAEGEILYTSPISDPLNEATLPETHPYPSTAPRMSVYLSVMSKQDAQ